MRLGGWLVAMALAVGLVPIAGSPPDALGATSPSKAKVFRTKGYKGLRAAPAVGPQQTPPSVVFGDGEQPDVLVDAAGTSHVVWTQKGAGAASDTTRYCRIPRGGTACDNPNTAPFTGPPAEYSQDFAGPRILQIGDGLVAISFRYPIVVDHPDGDTSDRTLYAWTSLDGGQSWTGPAIIGTLEPSGDAIVLGGNRIGVITDTVTGGTSFQVFPSGAYRRGGTLLGPGAEAYNGTIADDGNGVPVAAFSDPIETVIVRRWTGVGDIGDPATWSSASFPGTEPRLAGGAAGTWLMYRDGPSAGPRPWTVRPVAGGTPGAPQTLSDASVSDDGALVEAPNGTLRALWTTGISPERIVSRVAGPGGPFGGTEFVNQSAGDGSNVRADMTDDGGGAVVWRSAPGELRLSAFGTLSPTNRPGAGSRAGAGIPGATAGCTGATLGKIVIRPQSGCFFPAVDPAFAGSVVSEGEIDFGGLAIVPEANAKIVIDPRRLRFDTVGNVRVILRGGGLPDLTIFRGELHVDFKATGSGLGAKLFDFDTSGLDLGGFPIVGRIQVFLTEDGARIPLSLRLPPALGGVSGEATLVTKRGLGVSVESARIAADNVPVGPVWIQDLDIRWAGGDWSGSAVVALPPQPGGVKVGASVVFRGGAFKEGKLRVDVPFPGVLVAPNVYFAQFRGGFGVDPLKITAGATIGAFPLSPPLYTADVIGDLTVTFSREVVFELQATSRVLDLSLSRGQAKLTSSGYGEATGDASVDLGFLEVGGKGTVAFDAPGGRFSGEFSGGVSIGGVKLAGGAGLVSNAGLAACGEELGSSAGVFVSRSGGVDFFGEIGGDCDLSPYRGPPVARSAQAGPAAFTVPGGARTASVEIRGSGGVPDVVLVGPGGQRVAPVALGDAASRGAAAVSYGVSGQAVRVVALRRPAAGAWRVESTGGAAVAGVRVAVPAAAVKVNGSVRRTARGRVLAYRASGISSGTTVRVFERGRGISRPLGTVRNGAGTLRLRSDEGRGGARTIVALVERAAPVGRPRLTLARYVAPGAQPPGAVRKAKATLRKGALTVTWAPSRGARTHVVRIRLADGRVLLREVRGRARLQIRGLGADAKLKQVTVAGRTRAGLNGPAAKAALKR